MSFEPKLTYENHPLLGCIWHYGTDRASIVLNMKPTERQLRRLRKMAYRILRPIHYSALNLEKELNNV